MAHTKVPRNVPKPAQNCWITSLLHKRLLNNVAMIGPYSSVFTDGLRKFLLGLHSLAHTQMSRSKRWDALGTHLLWGLKDLQLETYEANSQRPRPHSRWQYVILPWNRTVNPFPRCLRDEGHQWCDLWEAFTKLCHNVLERWENTCCPYVCMIPKGFPLLRGPRAFPSR